jgi:hypothetical protein
MTTAYTSLLGLALPVTGELSGTWGDTVNNSITSLLDSAVAGTTTLSTDADVTLTTTTGAANTAREAILLWTAGGTVTRTITAPAQSKIYTVINASSSTQSIKLVGAGPTTGVTIIKGESALCAWNGSDFIKISNTAGAATVSDLTVTNSETLSYGTANGVAYLNGSKVLTTGSALTFDGANLSSTGGATFLGGPLGYGGGEIILGSTSADKLNAIVTQSTGTPTLYFDHRGTGNTGIWTWRNGTSGASEQMRLTNTGLGIGTSSPNYSLTSYKGGAVANYLQVASGATGAGSGNGLLLGVDSSGNSVINAQGAINLYTYVAGVLRTTIDSSGNLGLGVTPSAWSQGKAIEINNAGYGFWNGGSSSYMLANAYFNSGFKYAATAQATHYYQYQGQHVWSNAPSGTAGNAITFTQAMTLDASGRLLVGLTSDPGFSAQINIYNASNGGLTIGNSTNTTAFLQNANDFYIDVDRGGSAGNLIFRRSSSNTESARIDSSGNLLVGTTSSTYSAAGRGVIEVNGSSTSIMALKIGGSAAGYVYHDGSILSLNNTLSGALVLATGGLERARIDSSGNLLVGVTLPTALVTAGPKSGIGGLFGSANTAGSPGVQGAHTVNSATGYVAYFANSGSGTGLYISNTAAWQSTSDERLKTDIKDLDSTARLMQLRPVDYLWKTQSTSDDPNKRNLGFIAQEVQTVFPELVGVSPDGMYSVEYTGLIAPLVKAIQELKAEFDAYKSTHP